MSLSKIETPEACIIHLNNLISSHLIFLRVSEIKTEIIKQNGADFVIQSFSKQKPTDKDKVKVLHSGLIRLNDFKEAYYGDNISLKSNRKDFFIVEMQKGILTMYYFKNRNPRNKVKFSREFLKTINNLKDGGS